MADLCLFVTWLQLREIAIQPPDLWTYSNEGEFYKRAPAVGTPSSSPRLGFPIKIRVSVYRLLIHFENRTFESLYENSLEIFV